MTDDTNVTRFPGQAELPPCPMEIKRRDNFCSHPAVRLDDHSRTMECTECGATLDPYDFFRNQALWLQRAWQSHSTVKHDLNRLIERVAQLKKEEARLKGRIATAKKKLESDVVVVRPAAK